MTTTGPPGDARADVELRLPADSAYVSVLRTTSAGLAARLDFTLDDIEDLRMAVGEASALVLPAAAEGTDLTCRFYMDHGQLTVVVGRGVDDGDHPRSGRVRLAGAHHPRGRRLGVRRRRPLRDHADHAVRDPGRNGLGHMSDETREELDDAAAEDIPLTRVEQTRQESAALFARLRDDDAGQEERDAAREGLVHLHLPLVEHCARRFRNRGEPFEDLVQVGTIGLLKSVDRFDTDRGVEFSTYATPTIIGEIKRYFRDKGWAIRVPRRLQELRMQIGSTSAELTQSLGRSPTPRELAEAIGCSVEEILEGLESSQAYSTLSLDAGDSSDDGPASMLDSLGVLDVQLEHVEVRESLKPLLDRLDPREKKILLLRFFKNMTQSQIAEEIGVSQMHVSRLLTRTLEQLRASLEE